ncbi:hypothetical protein DMH26_00630 [Streptomyces sp. WAC 05379]|uniref:hypothetical protein n=1 Tax=Streptomyces sp. WAC 05379 TaxID=2203207 RepID=UPI000F73EBC6|nr:hypothetical protein [Streptomyces sp. WAC 05379]RSO09924.1 hypothetical protein DMH26_00630 [Streptomyces sp. WAC 05379]
MAASPWSRTTVPAAAGTWAAAASILKVALLLTSSPPPWARKAAPGSLSARPRAVAKWATDADGHSAHTSSTT